MPGEEENDQVKPEELPKPIRYDIDQYLNKAIEKRAKVLAGILSLKLFGGWFSIQALVKDFATTVTTQKLSDMSGDVQHQLRHFQSWSEALRVRVDKNQIHIASGLKQSVAAQLQLSNSQASLSLLLTNVTQAADSALRHVESQEQSVATKVRELTTNATNEVEFLKNNIKNRVADLDRKESEIVSGLLKDKDFQSRISEISSSVAPLGEKVESLIPVGTIFPYYGTTNTVLVGYVFCDRRWISKRTHKKLFDHLLNLNISGEEQLELDKDGERIRVPDLRGMFLRGLDKRIEGSQDPWSSENRNEARRLGSRQPSAVGPHKHPVLLRGIKGIGVVGGESAAAVDPSGGTTNTKLNLAEVSVPEPQFSESRPKNAAVNFIIKH